MTKDDNSSFVEEKNSEIDNEDIMEEEQPQSVTEKRQKGEKEIQKTYDHMVQLRKDIEFIQMLSNPDYIILLFHRGYFYGREFVQYLDSLNYLNQPKSLMMIKNPEGWLNLQTIKKKGFVQLLKSEAGVQKFREFCIARHHSFKSSSL